MSHPAPCGWASLVSCPGTAFAETLQSIQCILAQYKKHGPQPAPPEGVHLAESFPIPKVIPKGLSVHTTARPLQLPGTVSYAKGDF